MSAPKNPQKRAEWIAKISKGKKGTISPNKGKKFNDSWKLNLSKSHKGFKPNKLQLEILKLNRDGKNNYNYIDGRSSNDKWRRWIKNKRNRILRKKGDHNIGGHTHGEWENLKAQYNWKCLRCKISELNMSLTRDHIIPLSKGGSDNIENIQPLCMKCNLWKHTKIINFSESVRNDESL